MSKLQTLLSWFRKKEIPKPVIRLEATGFSLVEGASVALHIEWADVREIVAFKEDLVAYDEICVGFRTDDTGQFWRVTEKSHHYQELLEELPSRFAGIRTYWFSEVAFPGLVPNWTTLWGEPFRSQLDRE